MAGHKYKLTYFDLRAMGEPVRLIFKYAQVPFEDDRIDRADWGNLKSKYLELGVGQVPILEVDGKTIMTQSLAISRFAANQFGLVAKSPVLNFRSDEVVHVCEDARLQTRPLVIKAFSNPGSPELAQEFRDFGKNELPKYFKLIERIVGETKGPYIAGDQITVGDFVLFNWLDIWQGAGVITAEDLEQYPNIKALKAAFEVIPQIKAWLAERPKTAF